MRCSAMASGVLSTRSVVSKNLAMGTPSHWTTRLKVARLGIRPCSIRDSVATGTPEASEASRGSTSVRLALRNQPSEVLQGVSHGLHARR